MFLHVGTSTPVVNSRDVTIPTLQWRRTREQAITDEGKDKEGNMEYVKSELQRNINTLEQNAKISREYKNNFIKLFITVEEAKDLLKAIEQYYLSRSTLAS